MSAGPNGPAIRDVRPQRRLRAKDEAEERNSQRMGEANTVDNRQGADGQTGRAKRGSQPGVPSSEPDTNERALRTLGPAECLDLLEPGGIGRVGFASADGDHDNPGQLRRSRRAAIIFRTAPDTLLALYADAHVSFEVDRLDEALHAGWSVLLQGQAHKVTDEREVSTSRTKRASSRGPVAPAMSTCASRPPESAGDASSRAGLALRRQARNE